MQPNHLAPLVLVLLIIINVFLHWDFFALIQSARSFFILYIFYIFSYYYYLLYLRCDQWHYWDNTQCRKDFYNNIKFLY